MTAISDSIQRWAANPDGGGAYPERRDALLAHDPSCTSLDRAWTPRRNGKVCPSDLEPCEDCNVWFFIDGLGLYEDADGDDVPLCACCAKKRGLS